MDYCLALTPVYHAWLPLGAVFQFQAAAQPPQGARECGRPAADQHDWRRRVRGLGGVLAMLVRLLRRCYYSSHLDTLWGWLW